MKPVNFLFFLFAAFILGCQSIAVKSTSPLTEVTFKDTVLIVDMGLNNEALLKATGKMITSYFHLPVKYVQRPIPTQAFVKQRKRYDSNIILKELKKLHSNNYKFVTGLTSLDISTKKNGVPDYGIFGLGAMDGSSCITSICRLRKNADKSLLYNRVYKVVLHEIGHNFGVPHCISNKPCFMKDAEGQIKTVDNEPMLMCDDCNKKKRIV